MGGRARIPDSGFRAWTRSPRSFPATCGPPSYPCPVHHTLPGNGVLILENLVLSEVAGTRFTLFVGALKIIGGDGAWARVLALPST